jgi:hypothetical protein
MQKVLVHNEKNGTCENYSPNKSSKAIRKETVEERRDGARNKENYKQKK